ncbi:hypothetical protein EB796_004436 [Bugula neritina]|uniref:Uncharacterized protein n=1 Tax=Bugula neritina TaxID=10212 RepID=A0A7J7KIF4_BUGNE|nr:hypothetical protein EB796_004436 [Bugula neritina]
MLSYLLATFCLKFYIKEKHIWCLVIAIYQPARATKSPLFEKQTKHHYPIMKLFNALAALLLIVVLSTVSASRYSDSNSNSREY